MEKNNPKIINAWCSYDVANSVYNLVITSVLFPIYFQYTTIGFFHGDMVQIFGFTFRNSVVYDFTMAAAYFFIILLTPLLSGIADMGGYRKRFMRFFTIVGASACFSLYWFSGEHLEWGLLSVGLAVVGFAGSLVYYNSFLPIIATPDRHDKISSKGFSWGYAGSMILLIICIVMIEMYDKLGFSTKMNALRTSFLFVGIWWVSVSQIAFWYLKEYPGQFKLGSHVFKKGFREIWFVFKEIGHKKTIKWFLLSFWFFSMGVQTTMLVAALFASKELGFAGTKLIFTILLIQILGIGGSQLFGEISSRWGNKLSLSISVIIWIVICVSAFFIQTHEQFYVLAGMVGLVMGGIQSQARSTYAKLLPQDTVDTASYFTFYDITEKFAIVLGMFSFGFIEHLTGSMRNSTLVLSGFFIMSLVILLFTKLQFPKKYVN
jgi:UMF1 family MFS transporter